MQLDLSNVDSIVAWWRVFPERHDSYLDFKLAASPEFAHSILSARRLIDARPDLRALKPLAPLAPPSALGWRVPVADAIDDLAWIEADAQD
ncbi:hypothetical protein [Roseateles puraquae]|jgi:hypothetical protein|uniref:Uncharacterized protein n=1 Tax=Roseateles puraquae TaxID=431059 RepID=A0A254N535_9BURK|nr:hypothetical protein [Roseateles puraquae]MDG0856852.1 hypothetical protein [Roseateles puraquae]OWR01952.1 hypothetical protein CDO81_21720 [Roseateles puraquae]